MTQKRRYRKETRDRRDLTPHSSQTPEKFAAWRARVEEYKRKGQLSCLSTPAKCGPVSKTYKQSEWGEG